jgi:hypothetical protein
MYKKLFAGLAALLLQAAPFASATTISIDFSGIGYGVQVNNYYNGGTDSNGRYGPNYGVSFGGTIRNTPSGAYLSGQSWSSSGSTSMGINRDIIRELLGTDQYYIAFNAGRYDIDGGIAYVRYADGDLDTRWIGGNGNPYCGVLPGACENPYYGSMGGYSIGPVNGASVTSIQFNADRIDNILISNSPVAVSHIVGTYERDRDIPEPASLALLSIGAIALCMRYRKKMKL